MNYASLQSHGGPWTRRGASSSSARADLHIRQRTTVSQLEELCENNCLILLLPRLAAAFLSAEDGFGPLLHSCLTLSLDSSRAGKYVPPVLMFQLKRCRALPNSTDSEFEFARNLLSFYSGS